MATGRDLNLVVAQKHNAAVGGDMEERTQGVLESAAAVVQYLQVPTRWLGYETVNVLQVLCDLINLVKQMNTATAAHKHGPTPPPDNASQFKFRAAPSEQLRTITGQVEFKQIFNYEIAAFNIVVPHSISRLRFTEESK